MFSQKSPEKCTHNNQSNYPQLIIEEVLWDMGNGNYCLLLDECSHFKYYEEQSLRDIHFLKSYIERCMFL